MYFCTMVSKIRFVSLFLCILATISFAKNTSRTINLRIIHTSDLHGHFFPYDFINRKAISGSSARIQTYVDSLRKIYHNNLFLFDSGDILQGQPTSYYYNFVIPNKQNIAASVINYMKYDAQAIGNHDIETGHSVYDKWISETKCPILGANVIDTKTNKPYLKPYAIFKRSGIKIAVIGMITPAIPFWLNEKLWSNLRFDDIKKTSQYWISYLKKNENPDIIIGLFHSGRSGGITTADYKEDVALEVAKEITGFDVILFGHDHTVCNESIKNTLNKDIVCLNPSCYAKNVTDTRISLTVRDLPITNKKKRIKILAKEIKGEVVNIENIAINKDFVSHFKDEMDSINTFVNRKIGSVPEPLSIIDSFFGNGSITDIVHHVLLTETKADISLNAPVNFNTYIPAGDIHVSDLFNLYKYENKICVLKMTGEEIRKHLEMSYDLWVNTMKTPDDNLFLLANKAKNDMQRYGFKNLTFNFDSAAGIIYEVDVTKPNGQKVRIIKLSDGRPFDEKQWYSVAMNSYRAAGGGELLTKGARIPSNSIKERIIYESVHDLRYYLMKMIEQTGKLEPIHFNNWKFIPEDWVKVAGERDRKSIWGDSTKSSPTTLVK